MRRRAKASWLVVALAVVIVLSYLAAPYEPNCDEAKKPGQKECPIENVALISFRHVGKVVNDLSPAITALATVAIAVFTVVLAKVTGKAIDLGRQEFLATHRPRLRIRQVVAFEKGSEITIDAVLANVGDSTATIVAVAGADWQGIVGASKPNVPLRDVLRWTPVGASQRILKSGETAHLRYESDALPVRYTQRAMGRDLIPIWFLCVVRYTDDLGIERKTSTLRSLNEPPPVTRFIEVEKEPDYNYEE